MGQTRDKQGRKAGFTIVELLTVMSIIVILISILMPALNKVRRYAIDVKERAQLHAISTGLEAFSAELDGYPDSGAWDPCSPPGPYPYCGAMKLAEAMVGQDLRGFNPDSRFTRDGFSGILTADAPHDGMPYPPYGTIGVTPDTAGYAENIKKRKMYLQLENANANQIRDIWSIADIAIYSSVIGGFEPNAFVLCDVYNKVTNKTTGKKMGMPILYYKADPTKTMFPDETADFISVIRPNAIAGNYIYNVVDNLDFVGLPQPWCTGANCWQPMANALAFGSDPRIFYKKIRNRKVSDPWPYRADSFVLMSAGYDGEYGTGDDIFNFSD